MADKKADIKLSERPSKGEAIVGSAAEYAAYVNFGTRHGPSQPFLSTAGEIIARKLVGTITTEEQKAMSAAIAKGFKKQIKDGVEIIKYGNPFDGVELGNDKAILRAAVGVSSQAKSDCPVAEVNGGYLRNSIMWRTKDSEGGLNVR